MIFKNKKSIYFELYKSNKQFIEDLKSGELFKQLKSKEDNEQILNRFPEKKFPSYIKKYTQNRN